jgi:hypothetical protein
LAFFAFIYLRLFFRIETFQWVTADSNKKTSPSSRLACEVVSETPRRVRLFLLGAWESADFHEGKYTEGSRISQGFVRCNWGAAAKDPGSPMA